ncbi:MAG TPA: amidase [Xanthobacteraceae bacterium]
MPLSSHSLSAFVPHDLQAPIAGAATGPLAGLTCAVKDMYDIAGYRTGGGSPDWLAAASEANSSAAAVRRVLDAGATLIGKTICDEFFFSVTGANAHYGTPVNPRAPGRLPGGSSSGSAAATAAGACDFALGSDTGGSVRVPASFCGVYGIRPTHGRVHLSGAMAMAPSFDVAGWLANAPGVFRRVGQALLEGTSHPAKIEALIVLEDAFEQVDAPAGALLRSALAAVASDLPAPKQARVAPEGLDPWRECFRVIQGFEIWGIYGEFIERRRPRLGPGVRERLAFAAKVSQRDAEEARKLRARARDQIRRLAKPGTVLALPTTPGIAPRTDVPVDALEPFRANVMRLTCIAGLSGLPQVTIPIGAVSGCPVGLSFIGWAGGDEILLDLAVRLSRHCGRQG